MTKPVLNEVVRDALAPFELLLKAAQARTVAQCAQIDQLAAEVRELEELQRMNRIYGSEYRNV